MKDENKPDSSATPQSDESLNDDNVEENKKTKSDERFSTTASVSDSISRIRLKLDQDKVVKPSITFDIDGTEAPITFTNRREIIVGRTDPNSNQHPDIDVSGLPINFSSISRRHLRIIFSNGTWYAEDMGSRNGSWLNGKLLLAHQRYQVRNQDKFQIGTVNFSVSYRDEDAAPPPPPSPSTKTSMASQRLISKLILSTPEINPNQVGLSTTYLSEIVFPYLSAIISLMKHLDRAKKRPAREISIVSIALQQPHIVVEFSVKHEVLQFLHQQELNMAGDNIIMEGETTHDMDSDLLTADTNTLAQTFAKTFAEQHLPLITTGASTTFQQQFAESLEVVLDHNLRVVN